MEFFCDSDRLDKGSEVLLFMVHDGPGRASLQVGQGEALWQHIAPIDLGLATSEDHAQLEDTSVYKEWHLIYTVVETMCRFFQFLRPSCPF